jgi:hypothetical protein
MVAQLVPLSPQKIAEASRSLAAAFFDDPTSRGGGPPVWTMLRQPVG